MEHVKVYLLTKNLCTKTPNKRFNNVKTRLFLILNKKSVVAYILDLLPNIKIYLQFYINMLELVYPKTLI